MLVLSIDTSGKRGGIALFRDAPRLEAAFDLEGGSYSAELVPAMERLLAQNGLSARDLGGIVVVHGPGSFTGLRVGIGAAKGLAEALKVPLAAISSLELLARSNNRHGSVLAALDAGRREAYVGEYTTGNSGNAAELQCLGEELLTWDELAVRAQGGGVVVPEGNPALVDFLISRGLTVSPSAPSFAHAAAALGHARLVAGQSVAPETLDANYLRRSDAELFSLPKLRA